MKQIKIALAMLTLALTISSCSDEVKDKLIDFPNDVTLNKGEGISITPDHLSFLIPDAAFSASAYHSGSVTMNVSKNADGTHNGFALSNKNYRSYPWCNALPRTVEPTQAELKAATDSSLFSVYTNVPNQTKTFAVVRVSGDDAYFTIDKPRTVEHVLVANTNFNFHTLNYGSVFSATLESDVYQELNADGQYSTVRNPNIPDASSSKYRVWRMPDHYGFGQGSDYIRLAGHESHYGVKGYLKLTAKGYNGGSLTGESVYYLAVVTGAAPEPEYAKWNIIQPNWAKWDLTSLGMVDKVVFYMDSSDKDASGNMRTAPYFCMDGIRLQR